MGRIAALLNQKGGVGKTAVTLGLASAAAHAGHRVLVVDLDPQGSSTWVLGLDPAEQHRASSRGDRRSIALGTRGRPRRVVARASQRPSSSPLITCAVTCIMWPLDYDAVLVDCPPSLGNLTISGLTAADFALIVVDPAALGLRGIGAVADVIDQVWDSHNADLELAGVIVNRVPAVSAEADRRFDELTRIVGRKAIWRPSVPQRVIVNQAIGERRPIHSFGARAADVSRRVRHVVDEIAKDGSRIALEHQVSEATSMRRRPPRPSNVSPALPCTNR